MTTVAYRDGVIAANHGGSMADVKDAGSTVIFRPEDCGCLIGVSGNLEDALDWRNWYLNGRSRKEVPQPIRHTDKDHPDFTGMVITPNRSIEIWTQYYQPIPISGGIWAIGSGRMFAMGAMMNGASARESVLIARDLDPYTWGDVESLSF